VNTFRLPGEESLYHAGLITDQATLPGELLILGNDDLSIPIPLPTVDGNPGRALMLVVVAMRQVPGSSGSRGRRRAGCGSGGGGISLGQSFDKGNEGIEGLIHDVL